MSRRVYRRRRRRSRRKKWLIVVLSIALIAGLAYAASVLLGFNPFLERQLRSQFGDAFFNDFEVSKPVEAGSDPETIINNYEPLFKSLENEALTRLDTLLTGALDDYRRQEQDGTLDRFMLTSKYIQAGRILESSVDEIFYDLLDEMKAELSNSGFSTAIAADIEETYQNAKTEKKRELLERLRQQIGG